MATVQRDSAGTTSPDSGQDAWTWRVRFLVGAFVVLSLYVLVQVHAVLRDRSPQARLEALLATVGAERVGVRFDPRVHDRTLIVGPSDQRRTIRLGDFDTDVLVVNFWATWCRPCLDELPSLLQLARQLRGASITFVAISYDASWKDVADFFERALGRMPRDIVVALDPDRDHDPLRHHWGTEKLPETYTVRDGVILHKFVAAHDWSEPAKLDYFELLLAEGP